MRLTVEEHREAIKRYAHVKPARGRGRRRCAARLPGTARTCTCEKAHRGPHVAHGPLGRVVAVWDWGSAPRPTAVTKRALTAPTRRGGGTRRPIGLPTRSPVGVLKTLRSLAVRLMSSADEIVFIILFLVLVKFAIDVLQTLR